MTDNATTTGPAIFVVDNGFVFYAKQATKAGGSWTLTDARCIRRWGTTNVGLGGLVSGPTADTVLEATIPSLLVDTPRVVFIIPNVRGNWSE